MGAIGAALGGLGGSYVGGKIAKGKYKKEISTLGSALGSAIPWFKKGGAVPRTEIALVHKNEFVLPKGVKPTKEQKKMVNAIRKMNKK
jgi:hypothetical protein